MQTYSRFTPWMPSSSKDVIVFDGVVSRAIVSAIAVPLIVLGQGSCWFPHLPDLATESPQDKASRSIMVVNGYSNPNPNGFSSIPKPIDKIYEKLSPPFLINGYSNPRPEGLVWLSKPRLDQGPDRQTTSVISREFPIPSLKNGFVWTSGWSKGIYDPYKKSPVLQNNWISNPPYPGKVTWIGVGVTKDNAEFQHFRQTAPYVFNPDLSDPRRRYPGSYWSDSLGGRQDPPSGQTKSQPALVSVLPFASSLLSKGQVIRLLRTSELIGDRQTGSAINTIFYPNILSRISRGSVWMPGSPKEDVQSHPVLVSKFEASNRTYPGKITWTSPVKETGIAAKPTIVTFQDRVRFLNTGSSLFTGRPTDIPNIPMVPPRVLVIKRENSPVLWRHGTFGIIGRGTKDVSAINPGDYYWRAGLPMSGWTLSIIEEDVCESPWQMTLVEGWTVGDPEQ